MSDETPWEVGCLAGAAPFAEHCVEMKKTNPYESDVLKYIMPYLMTELWDRGFSQTEIRTAFEEAIHQLPGYAVQEKRF
jgi:hypothetical protein